MMSLNIKYQANMINNILFSIFFCSGLILFLIAERLNFYLIKVKYNLKIEKYNILANLFVVALISILASVLFNIAFSIK